MAAETVARTAARTAARTVNPDMLQIIDRYDTIISSQCDKIVIHADNASRTALNVGDLI
jgi:hypothetical protein